MRRGESRPPEMPAPPATPPADAPLAPGELADGVPCPFCRTGNTELVSPFGGQLSVAQYWCRRCRTGFDYMKWS